MKCLEFGAGKSGPLSNEEDVDGNMIITVFTQKVMTVTVI
jgi:hypothetical protein